MKTIAPIILTVAIALLIVLCFAIRKISLLEQHIAEQRAYIQQFNYIPTISDIQQRLVNLGYDIKVDGKIGGETITAWGLAIGTQIDEKLSGHYYEDAK